MTPLRSGASALALLIAGVLVTPALAQQQPTPPEHYTLDRNGVDLVSGEFTYSTTDVVIGDPSDGGLTHARVYTEGGWRDTAVGTIQVSGSIYVVSLGAESEVFVKSGTTFTPQSNTGATLVQTSSTILTFTTRNGSVATFSTVWSGNQMAYDANGAALTSYATPNGEQTTYHWDGVTYCQTRQLEPPYDCMVTRNAVRLEGITNNRGYLIKYIFAENGVPEGIGVQQWLRRTQTIGINLKDDYCNPNADSCTGLTRTWPSMTYVSGPYGGRITTATDQSGRATGYSYGSGGLSGIFLPDETGPKTTAQVTIDYNAQGRVSSVNGPNGEWDYTYTDDGNERTTVSDGPNGQKLTVVSDQTIGRAESVTDALNRKTVYTYDSQRRLDTITLPEGNGVDYAYDGRGNITTVTQTAKPSTGEADIVAFATYSSTCANPRICNRPTAVTDPRGNTTNFTYNTTHGGVLTITAPAPTTGAARPQTRFTYEQKQARYKNGASTFTNGSAIWMPTQTSECVTGTSCAGTANEVRSTIAYPASTIANNLQPTSMTMGSGDGSVSSTWGFTWTPNGDVLFLDGPLAGTSDRVRYLTDAARQVFGVVTPDPDGSGPLLYRATRYTYRPDGLVSRVEQGTTTSQNDSGWSSFATLQKVETDYDLHLRPTRTRVMGPTTTIYAVSDTSYDASGRVDCVATRMNLSNPPTAACTAGSTSTFGPDRITRSAYDVADQLTILTRGLGVDPIQESLTYRPNGTVYTVTNGRGFMTTMLYDGFDRVTRLRYPDPTTPGVSNAADYDGYTYDANGNVLTLRPRQSTGYSFIYDALNRMTYRNAPGSNRDVTLAYDNLGRPTSASQSGSDLSWTYDALGRVLTQGQPAGTVTRQYDAAGRRTRLTWPGGSPYVTYQYNVANDLTAVCVNATSCTTGSLALYAYDNLGRRTTATQGGGPVSSWAYDPVSRLNSLSHDLPGGTTNDVTFIFTYNPAFQIQTRHTSNSLYVFDKADGSLATPVDGLDQFDTVGGASASYDARGNFLSGGVGRSYTYAGDNELASVTGGTASTLAYDPVGRLLDLTGTNNNRFLYDGDQVIGTTNPSTGAVAQRFVPGDWVDEKVAFFQGSSVTSPQYLPADERGSIVAPTNTSGGVAGINTYDDYGIPGPGNVGRFGYTGQMWLADAQAWHYKARTYHPGLGRFLQTDPIGYGDGLNLYIYVDADPLNYVDPWGLQEECPDNDPTCDVPTELDEIVVVGRRIEDCDFWCLLAGFGRSVGEFLTPGSSSGGRDHEWVVEELVYCGADAAFAGMAQAGMSAPGAPAAQAGFNPEVPLLLSNRVSQYVNFEERVIINTTLEGHRYFPGEVSISVRPLTSATSYVRVVGTGTTRRNIENEFTGTGFFGLSARSVGNACSPATTGVINGP